MALFAVTRYLGDDEESGENKKDKASKILQKLKEQAKARKLNLEVDKSVEVEKNGSKSYNSTKQSDGSKGEMNKHICSDSESGAESTKNKRRKKLKASESDQKSSALDETETYDSEVLERLKVEPGANDFNHNEDFSKISGLKSEVSNDTDIALEEKRRKSKKRKHKTTDEDPELATDAENHVCSSFESGSDSSPRKNKHKRRKRDDDFSQVDSSIKKEALEDADGVSTGGKAAQGDSDDSDNEEEESEDADVTDVKPGEHREIGGFTVIGRLEEKKVEKVKRVLPDWLSSPNVLSADLTTGTLPVSDMPGLSTELVDRLKQSGISHFFPVQMHVIPALLKSSITGPLTGRAGYRPSDICVSAPTGSGKTLAFVLPIIQALQSCVTCQVRALAVLPVQDLAVQVYNVFKEYCTGTNLKVGLLVGQHSLAAEQQLLVSKRLRGYESMYDIIVATPGRLVDHLNKTDGFHLGHLRFLVIDEADRMMEVIKHDWLMLVEASVHKHRPRLSVLTAASSATGSPPLQKLLFSATLSQNPEKLQQLNLFQPVLFTSSVKGTKGVHPTTTIKEPKSVPTSENTEINNDDDREEDDEPSLAIKQEPHMESEPVSVKDEPEPDVDKEEEGEMYGKYATPTGLVEYMMETSAEEKPLMILHLLHNLKYKNILCFTNSMESTHRLFLLIKQVGDVKVKEFSSGLRRGSRSKILQQFSKGNVDILICTDAMARGIDIANVQYVVSYDNARFIKTYIHRVGRTARAGREGTAITLLAKNQCYHFKKMIRDAGKHVRHMKIHKWQLKPLIPKFQEALLKLPNILKEEQAKKMGRLQKLKSTEARRTEIKAEHDVDETTVDTSVTRDTGTDESRADSGETSESDFDTTGIKTEPDSSSTRIKTEPVE